MKVSLLTLLLLTASVYASEINNILSGISEPSNFSPTIPCEEDSEEDLSQQCAVDLCGPPESALSGFIDDTNFDYYVKPGTKDLLAASREPVQKLFERNRRNLKEFIRVLKSKLPAIDISKLNQDELEDLTRSLYARYVVTEIDKSRPIEERLKVYVQLPEDATSTFRVGLKAYAQAFQQTAATSPALGLSIDLYTKEEGSSLIADLSKMFIKEYEALIRNGPRSLSEKKDIIEKFKNIEEQLRAGAPLGMAYRELEALYRETMIAAGRNSPPKPSICLSDCKNATSEYLSFVNYEKKLLKIGEIVDHSDPREAQESCEAEIINRSRRESDQQSFMGMYPSSKDNFLKKVFAGYSSHSRNAFSEYLDKEVHFSFSNPHDLSPKNFVFNLQLKSEASTVSYGRTDVIQLINQLHDYRKPGYENDYDLELGCGKSKPFAAWDGFQTKELSQNSSGPIDRNLQKDNFLVSMFSCTHLQHGAEILTHELGHALSYAFIKGKLSKESEEAYNRLRKCITDSYRSPLHGHSHFKREGDSKRTEEDMADVIQHFATQSEDKIASCIHLERNRSASRYVNLQLDKDITDTHSAPLLRVLMEAIYKKKEISSACRMLLDKNKNRFDFKGCL